MADAPQPQQAQLQIDNANLLIPYSDMAMIRVTPFGMSFDFMQHASPGRAQIVSRVGMSPQHAKDFLRILQANIAALEKGAAPVSPEEASTKPEFGFTVPKAKQA